MICLVLEVDRIVPLVERVIEAEFEIRVAAGEGFFELTWWKINIVYGSNVESYFL